MPVKVVCNECNAKFEIADRAISGQCPKCGATRRKPQDAKGSGKPKVKCPSCKKTLSAGMTFCAACGISVGTADAGDAYLAGKSLEAKSANDIERWRWIAWLFRMFR